MKISSMYGIVIACVFSTNKQNPSDVFRVQLARFPLNRSTEKASGYFVTMIVVGAHNLEVL